MQDLREKVMMESHAPLYVGHRGIQTTTHAIETYFYWTSMKQGVHHFSVMYKTGQRKGVDLATIIQSYNMGSGYIDYVSKHGGKHTEKLAKEFSEKQVKKNPDLYNCGGNKNNFRYPYCYGDYSYTEKVMERTKKVEERIKGLTLGQ